MSAAAHSLPDWHVAGGMIELIGNTPLVEITRLNAGPCRLFAKLEGENPGGSMEVLCGCAKMSHLGQTARNCRQVFRLLILVEGCSGALSVESES